MRRSELILAAGVTGLLVVFASGYGYHRDELYFLAAGDHLAWGYADQGPLTPLIAAAMDTIALGSLIVLRIPSALAAGAIVLLTADMAGELGAPPRGRLIAGACIAVSPLLLFTGHLLSTSTFDLLVWTSVCWLAVRALSRGDERLWLAAGVVLGLGLLNKPLPAFLVFGLLIGVVIAGPRRLLASPWVWGGAAAALVLWAPWLIWQADHGWPQIDVAEEIAGGGSASSEAWWAVVPFQFLLFGPLLAPVWIAGLVRLFRDPALRRYRLFAWAWAALAVAFMATAGKPYYLAGLMPVLIAAGAIRVDAWIERAGGRRAAFAAALGASAAVALVISLPLLPARDADFVVEMNEDVGETIGWPALARTVASVADGLGSDDAVVLGANYGEAGALDRYGPDLGIDRVYGVHNAYWDWGPPPDRVAPVVLVGFGPSFARARFRDCVPAATVDNGFGMHNEEQGVPVIVCKEPLRPWSEIWDDLRTLG